MKRSAWHTYRGTILVLLGLALVGTTVMVYILLNQRFPNPLADVYKVEAELPSADGVSPGSGQPVKVAGVPVGVISALRLEHEVPVVTLSIRRDELPEIHRDAAVTLRPISPLKDLQIVLDPGTPRAGVLAEGGTTPLERALSPVDLDELLAALDGDTRSFLSLLIDGVGAGTADRGSDMAKTLRALGPTAHQVGALTTALERRRDEIRRLVSNIGTIARAASTDHRLDDLVLAGNTTLKAIATDQESLQTASAELPGALGAAGDALPSVEKLADELVPTMRRLGPAVRELPAGLRSARGFARLTAHALDADIRPLAREAAPVVADAGDAVGTLKESGPELDSILRVLTYAVNELSYNPPGDDEGLLFWTAWAGHNAVSSTSTADANGALVRATVFVSCALPQGLPGVGSLLADALGATPLCESGKGGGG